MTIVMMDRTKISWESIDRAREFYREQYGPEFSIEHYQDWMLHEWGVLHKFNSISVDDEVKYTAFLLRWA
jgi:hypothetical protein